MAVFLNTNLQVRKKTKQKQKQKNRRKFKIDKITRGLEQRMTLAKISLQCFFNYSVDR